MSKLPSKKHWEVLQERADKYYSLRRAYNKFIIDKAKLVSDERNEREEKSL